MLFRNQLSAQQKKHIYTARNDQLKLFMETTAVCCKDHIKHVNTVHTEKVQYLQYYSKQNKNKLYTDSYCISLNKLMKTSISSVTNTWLQSSGIWYSAAWQMGTKVFVKPAVLIFRAEESRKPQIPLKHRCVSTRRQSWSHQTTPNLKLNDTDTVKRQNIKEILNLN